MSNRLVLHITNRPTPYRLPFYRAVCIALNAAGFDFFVLFLGTGKRERNWTFNADDFKGISYGFVKDFGDRPIKSTIAVILKKKPAVVVLAWAMDPLALRLLRFCRKQSLPCLVVTGETEKALSQRTHPWLRNIVRQPFFHWAAGFIAYGTEARQYLLNHGVAAERVSIAINVVDTWFFLNEGERLHGTDFERFERNTYKTESGKPFICHLLCIGYLIPGKGIEETLKALQSIGRDDIALHIVGSGPEEDKIRGIVGNLGLNSTTFLHGFKQKNEIPAYYHFSDVVLFPSFVDVFGLVMLEAAAIGRPVIASKHSGGTADVIEDGMNGFIIDPANIDEYAATIVSLSENPKLRERMGNSGRAIARERLTPEKSAEGYLEAITRAVGSGSK